MSIIIFSFTHVIRENKPIIKIVIIWRVGASFGEIKKMTKSLTVFGECFMHKRQLFIIV